MNDGAQARTITAAIMGVQAFLGGVGGLALMAFARRHPRRGFAVAGAIGILIAAGLAAAAVAVVRRRSWARPVGLTVEGLIALLALGRIAARPLASIVGLALAVVAIVLLVQAGADRPGPVADPPYPRFPDRDRPPAAGP